MPKPVPSPSHELSPESERRERARGASGGAVESVAKAARRSFSTAEKLRILKKADACLASGKRGALGAMLREEGIYSSHLSTWRTQVAEASNAALAGRKPGRKAKLDAKDRRIAELEKRNAELERRLHVADVLIDLQKKAHAILGIALPKLDDGES